MSRLARLHLWPLVMITAAYASDGNLLSQLAMDDLAVATAALGQKIRYCEGLEQHVAPDSFHGISMTTEQARDAISYLSVKASNTCLMPEAGAFMIATELVAKTSTHLAVTNERQDYGQLVMGSYLRQVELQSRYIALPSELRSELEAIEALQRPFPLVPTFESLMRRESQ